MKSKKYILALLIFGGALFTANAANIININIETETTGVDLKQVKVPNNGQ